MHTPLANAFCTPSGRHITVIAILRDITNIRLIAAGLYPDNRITTVLRRRIGIIRLNFNDVGRIMTAAHGRIVDANFFHIMPVQHCMAKNFCPGVGLCGHICLVFIFSKAVSIVENFRLERFKVFTVDFNSQQALCATCGGRLNGIIPSCCPIRNRCCFRGGITCIFTNQRHFNGYIYFSTGLEFECHLLHTNIFAFFKLSRSRQLFGGHNRKFAFSCIRYELQFQLFSVLQNIGCVVILNHDLSFGVHKPIQFRIILFQVNLVTYSQCTASI